MDASRTYMPQTDGQLRKFFNLLISFLLNTLVTKNEGKNSNHKT